MLVSTLKASSWYSFLKMLLNMAIMEYTKKIIKKKETERHVELVKPDLIGLNCKDSSEMENEFLVKKVQNLTTFMTQDVGSFIKKIDNKLYELYRMVSKFRVDSKTSASYREMVGDEVRCKLLEWRGVVARVKAEHKKWRTLNVWDKLMLIQLELDLDECKRLVTTFVEKFETIKSNLKGNPISPILTPTS